MKHKPIHKIRLDFDEPYGGEEKHNYESINCPSCTVGIKSEDINLSNKIGECASCQIIFSTDELIHKLRLGKKTYTLAQMKLFGLLSNLVAIFSMAYICYTGCLLQTAM